MPERLPDPRFPVPELPDQSITWTKREYYPEIDLDAKAVTMSDGRSARVENWLDCETQTLCRTFYYSTLEIENWDGPLHYKFLKNSHQIDDKDCSCQSVGLNRINDLTGELLWVVTVSIRDDEE